jgi:hypothetical protein
MVTINDKSSLAYWSPNYAPIAVGRVASLPNVTMYDWLSVAGYRHVGGTH